MARTNKKGLDYFPVNVDFFDDDKIQLIESEYGIIGSSIAVRLLCKIYKEDFFYRWGEDQLLLFSRPLNVASTLVDEIVSKLVKRGIFDMDIFEKYNVLTSRGIQTRYFDAVVRYKSIDACKEYLLIDVSKMKNVNIYSINVDTNPETDEPKAKKPRKKDKSVDSNDWRSDYKIYLEMVRNAFTDHKKDPKWIADRERFHPNVDILLSLEKACKDFWATEAGWKHKKASRTSEIDWTRTFNNAISQSQNKVFKGRYITSTSKILSPESDNQLKSIEERMSGNG